MKIAILGTRGVPNYHGGFEQFTEFLSEFLVKKGHEIYVFNSHTHPYKKKTWNDVIIVHKYDPENKLGTFGQFIYDLNCIIDCRKKSFDLILQLGYTSSSIWGWLLPKKSIIVTNMDGLEWKRSKYKPLVRKFLKKAEMLGVKYSDFLIADSIGIQSYLKETYGINSKYIAYGATLFDTPNLRVLDNYNVKKYNYNLLIARLEPENNIETILDGVVMSSNEHTFLVIGKHKTKYGEYLKNKFSNYKKIKFLGGIYNQDHLNNLRYFSNLYFHGHSVGGTNPSLLEAMASNAFIIANNNIFNRSILGKDAFYFEDSNDVKMHLDYLKLRNMKWIQNNREKILQKFDWNKINLQYERYLLECLKS